MSNRPVILIDSNAILHRAYHAYPKNLSTKSGQLVNAVFGFLSITLQVIEKFNPSEIYFAFDAKGKTFRHKTYKDYKATRKKTDEELITQFQTIKDLLKRGGFEIIEIPGYEADDILGTLSKSSILKDKQKIIVSGDGDLLQLIDDDVSVFLSGTSFQKSSLYDAKKAKEKLGYPVAQVVEYKALRGDSSDNIPGVTGIGDVSARKILSKYKNLDEIYENLDNLENAIKSKLTKDRRSAFMSRDLATIVTNVPIELGEVKNGLQDIDYDELYNASLELEFKSLLPRINKLESKYLPQKLVNETQHSQDLNVDKGDQRSFEFGSISEQDYTTILKTASRLIIQVNKDEQENYTDVRFLVGSKYGFICKCDSKEYMDMISMIGKNKIDVVAFDSKELHELHLYLDMDLLEVKFDIRLAAYLLSGGSLKLDFESISFEFLSQAPRGRELQEEVEYLEKIYVELKNRIEQIKGDDWNIKKLFYEVELPLTRVIAKMEKEGIKLDVDYLKAFELKVTNQIAEVENEVYKLAGQEFNLASPKQLGDILFDKLKYPGGKKGKSGSYSTNEKVLRNLVDKEIVQKVLVYRELAKLKSTYTSTLMSQVDKETGRVHSDFRQDVAITGRLNSTDPNLQNIPVSSELGQEVRRAFISEKDTTFLFLDYSQQELRLLAHLSNEKHLIEAFSKNIDIHALTASKILQKDLKEVTKNDRRAGKTINFGIIYGISAFGLADRLKIDNKLAQAYIDGFFNSYPAVREYYNSLLEKAKKQGYVETIGGRRKYTEGLNSNVFQVRKAVEREIMNFPMQGGAADMIKLAMVRVQDRIDGKYGDYAKIVLQVHDELDFEVEEKDITDKLKSFAKDMSDLMLEAFDLKVPMKVDVEIGKNLADRKNLILD